MVAVLVRKSIDREQNLLQLYGEVKTNAEELAAFAPGSQIQAGVLVTEKSLFESFFDFNLYGYIIGDRHGTVIDLLEKVRHWVEY